MKLCIRAHDLGVKGTAALLDRIQSLGLDGVQMVCYKAYDDIAYQPGAITAQKAAQIGKAFQTANAEIPMIGAYFNPVHSDKEKVRRCREIFADYLRVAKQMGCLAVGSETGSFNDDKWTFHPRNRTEEALQMVVATFSELSDIAQDNGATVAMEGAAGHVCWNVDTLARARRMMNRRTKVVFDLYNYLDETNQSEYLTILDRGLDTFAGEILLFHMKDCQFVNGQKPNQMPLGTGQMDMQAILKRIKAYDKDAVLTLEGTTGEHIAHAMMTIKNIWESV